MALQLQPGVPDAIRRHGAETYPDECCGALLGRDGVVNGTYALPNTTEEGPRRRFLVRPDDYRQAEQRARQEGGDLLGFYHSHPDHPARPSQQTRSRLAVFSYIIVSVQKGEPQDMTSWRLREDRSAFDQEISTMPNTIHIPTPLRPFTDKKESIEVSGGTVGELLADLTARYEGLRKHLYTDEGRLRNFVNVYLNDEDIRYLQREKTPVKSGDSLSIVPSVAGGAPVAAEKARGKGTVDEELPNLSQDEIALQPPPDPPEVGMDGQRRLKAGSVLCIGAGGLGSPAAMYLAAAGIGRIGIVDFDVVDFSNLQRQLLHGTPDVGRSKPASPRTA